MRSYDSLWMYSKVECVEIVNTVTKTLAYRLEEAFQCCSFFATVYVYDAVVFDTQSDGSVEIGRYPDVARPPAQHAVEDERSRSVDDVHRRMHPFGPRQIVARFVAPGGVGHPRDAHPLHRSDYRAFQVRPVLIGKHVAKPRLERQGRLMADLAHQLVRGLRPRAA